jgi:hypothetical protein
MKVDFIFWLENEIFQHSMCLKMRSVLAEILITQKGFIIFKNNAFLNKLSIDR